MEKNNFKLNEISLFSKISKSTIHKDMTERLPKINPSIAEQTQNILELNKAERHIRGGKATKLKYKAIE